MREITLHIIDIVENSVAAQANSIQIIIEENLVQDYLLIDIIDNGKGMDKDTISVITDPFTTSRTERKVGLGIPLFKEAAEMCNGSLSIESSLGVGTKIRVQFKHSHIDRMPLGDVAATFYSLLIAHQEIHWEFHYKYCAPTQECQEFHFDDKPIKETLGEIPLTEPSVLTYLRETIYEGISQCKK